MKPNVHRIKKLGKLGENFLENLCIGAGWTCSKPGADENGWDFLVELPQNRLPSIYLDSQPAPMKLLCQVKSTDDFSSRKLDIAVSNHEHLARTPIPSFVLVFDFAGADSPSAAYLCHFDRHRISMVLQRIRELEANGERSLHKHSLVLSAKADEVFSPVNSETFKSLIVSHTGLDASKYADEKNLYLRTTGFENGRYKLSFATAATPEAYIEALLGLGELTAETVTISSSRFGIDIQERSFAAGKFSIDPVMAGECQIIASSVETRRRVTIIGQVILPPITGISDRLFKVRIKLTFGEMLLSAEDCSFSFQFDQEKLFDLDELISAAEFLVTLSGPDSRIEFFRGKTRFAVSDKVESLGEPDYCKALAQRARLLQAFLRFANVRQTIYLRLGDLFSQDEPLSWMSICLSKEATKLKARVSRNSNKSVIEAKGVFATPLSFKVGDSTLMLLCHWEAFIRVIKLRVTCQISNCQIYDSFILDLEMERFRSFYQYFQDFCTDLSKGTLIFKEVIFEDQRQVTSNETTEALDTKGTGAS